MAGLPEALVSSRLSEPSCLRMDTDRTASTRLTLRRHFRDVAVEFEVVLTVAREGVENGSVASQLGEPSKFVTGAGINHREIIGIVVQRGQDGGLGLWPKQHGFHCKPLTILTRGRVSV